MISILKQIRFVVLGGLAGVTFTALCVSIISSATVSLPFGLTSSSMYEIAALIIGGLGALVIAILFSPDDGLCFALGYGFGMPSVILTLRPANSPETRIFNFAGVFALSFTLIELWRLITSLWRQYHDRRHF